MKIDIGGGLRPKQGFINLDPVHGEDTFKRKLQDGIPVEDNSIDELYCSHTLEHIPAADRIACINECNRVLKINGIFEIIVPIIGYTDSNNKGHYVNNCAAWADPTHVSYFWMPESFLYFTNPEIASADYGIKYWKLLSAEINDNAEGRVILQKI
jgi:predicted SAM-dependent methyltransferase